MRKRNRTLKTIPTFESEDAEREFWETADSTEHVDWSAARIVRFPNLRRADVSKNQDIIDTSGQFVDAHDKP